MSELAGTRERTVIVAALGILGGVLAAVGTAMEWYTIEIGGVAAPGGSTTGLEGRDGLTVLAGAVAAGVGATLVLLGRRLVTAKILFLAAGGITTIVATAAVIDATSKDHEVEEAFGIPADRVSAEVGTGLWFVALGGISELAAGVLSRSSDEAGDAVLETSSSVHP